MGVNTKVTAQSARNTSDAAERLINCLLKGVKESAEMGVTLFTTSLLDISPVALDTVENTFKSLGFDIEMCSETYKTEVPNIVHTETTLVVRW